MISERGPIISALEALQGGSPAISAAMVSTVQGRLLGATAGEYIKLCGVSAATLAIANKTAVDMRLGDLDQVQVLGHGGCVVVMRVGSEAVMTLVIGDRAKAETATNAARRILPDIEALV